MRRTAPLLILLALAAFVAVGCGGPDDPKKSLAEACQRQIEEVEGEAHGGDTKEADTTKKFVEEEQLVECAGQPSLTASMRDAQKEAGADAGEGADGEAGNGEEAAEGEGDGATTPVLDEAALAAERETFTTSCASCHVLGDAKATGSFGPDLDTSTMSVEDMTAQIENGGGGMPPALLTGDDAASMSAYIDAVRAG